MSFRYDKREEAFAAIEHLNGTIPHGRTNPISVKIAEEHGKQKAAYFAGWEAGRQQARRKRIVIPFYIDILGHNMISHEKRSRPLSFYSFMQLIPVEI